MPEFAPVIGLRISSTGESGVRPWHTSHVSAATGSSNYRISSPPDRFTEFETYHTPNWDGDDAEPITSDTLAAARRFNQRLPRELPPADIAPGADGTIGFEWREGPPETREFVIVEIGPGDRVKAKRISRTGIVSKFAPVDLSNWASVAHLFSMLFPQSDVPAG